MIPNPNEILMTHGIFSIKPTKWFLGYLTSQKPLESFANMCSLVFIKICWFLFFFGVKFEVFQNETFLEMIPNPNEILMTSGIFSIKPTKWFLGYLTSQKPLESFANKCSLVFIKICWFLIFLVSTLRFFKTSRFWKWFQTQMRSWWPMESFLSNQQNDSWGIWHLKSLWNHLQICVLWFSLKSVDFWFFWCQFWGFSKRAVFGNDFKPKWDLDDPWNLFYQINKMIFLGYLTSQKPLESFANMCSLCSLVFIKICWFLIFLVSILRFFKTRRFWKGMGVRSERSLDTFETWAFFQNFKHLKPAVQTMRLLSTWFFSAFE